MSKVYPDAPKINILEFIPANSFRTILATSKKFPHGRLEIPVVIHIAKNSILKTDYLAKCFTDATFINGFVKLNKNLMEIMNITENDSVKSKTILMNEWDEDTFLVTFKDTDTLIEKNSFAKTNEVGKLLANCLNPNIQYQD